MEPAREVQPLREIDKQIVLGSFFIVSAARYSVWAQNGGSIVFIAVAILLGVFFIVWAIYGFSAHNKMTGDLQ